MSEEYGEGDVIRLNGTDQEGEVLEVIRVHGGEPGPLLRVQLHDADAGTRKTKDKAGKPPLPEIAYYPVHSVMLVSKAADAAPKKGEHQAKADHHDKAAQHETRPAHNLGRAKP